jgi:hypothetical protein
MPKLLDVFVAMCYSYKEGQASSGRWAHCYLPAIIFRKEEDVNIEGYLYVRDISSRVLNLIENHSDYELVTGNDAIWALLTGKEEDENGRTDEENNTDQ